MLSETARLPPMPVVAYLADGAHFENRGGPHEHARIVSDHPPVVFGSIHGVNVMIIGEADEAAHATEGRTIV